MIKYEKRIWTPDRFYPVNDNVFEARLVINRLKSQQTQSRELEILQRELKFRTGLGQHSLVNDYERRIARAEYDQTTLQDILGLPREIIDPLYNFVYFEEHGELINGQATILKVPRFYNHELTDFVLAEFNKDSIDSQSGAALNNPPERLSQIALQRIGICWPAQVNS